MEPEPEPKDQQDGWIVLPPLVDHLTTRMVVICILALFHMFLGYFSSFILIAVSTISIRHL